MAWARARMAPGGSCAACRVPPRHAIHIIINIQFMKKILMSLVALLTAVSASAQFESEKYYLGASLTGLNLSYSGLKELSLGVGAKAGYLVDDNLMLLGEVGYDDPGKGVSGAFTAGAGGRYYIEQNGLFIGANAKFVHSKGYNDVMPGLELGYAFFLNRTVTIEPAVYYQQSFKNHSDYSTVGLRIGIGIYLERD